MSITKGLSFGVSEQITNTKLHNLVDNATLSVEYDEFAPNFLPSLPTTAGYLKTKSLVGSLASGAFFKHDGSGGLIPSFSVPTNYFVNSLASGALLRHNGSGGWYAV